MLPQWTKIIVSKVPFSTSVRQRSSNGACRASKPASRSCWASGATIGWMNSGARIGNASTSPSLAQNPSALRSNPAAAMCSSTSSCDGLSTFHLSSVACSGPSAGTHLPVM